ncbi:hypothetical protein [Sorangium sp. So ce363]|uniref:hypothetical protein n=1 Tax=Sorangium sp. So ce363 TaxID=3133304 RepID=UPI003F627CE2
MYRIGIAAFAALSLASLVGCIAVQEEDESVVGVAPSALEFVNALNPNALNPNALNPYLNTCYNEVNRDHARSLCRDCAAGHLSSSGTAQPCGMINIVGSCDSACEPLKQRGMYYPSCATDLDSNVDSTTKVITVFLP